MSKLLNPDHFIKEPIEKMTQVPIDGGLYSILTNRYWLFKDGNIFFYGSYCYPQCNSDEKVMDRHPRLIEGAGVIFLGRVFVPHNCEDYL